ncbi:MAG: DUF5107 domain-containing protein [Bacteroidales bacterium]|nr:DUF5107 domain-containing protein [Bacteroidales bacterium]MCF8345527.1 DUF5107 domain-containing protein [Bacteroidales bacterium]MCF8345691.1 DUF5107 domain-containing protein [Bacteroidales bacterium]
MKKSLHIFRPHLFLAFILVLMFSGGQLSSQVTQRDTILKWRHFDYTLDAGNGMESYSTNQIVEEEYQGVVLENEYVRLVILPDFGARIISFLYKPKGHEQFYTNPVGTPYGMGDGNFYYDWLMVFGGVFPTFPEPEHGKTWLLPWQWEFTEISEESISLSMQIKDTMNYTGHPGKFNNGVTDVICTSTVRLEKGKTSFELNHSLQNTKSSEVILEYWTCATLAPGSVPENTFTPANSKIIAPIDFVYLKDDWWSWMGNAEVPAPQQGNHVFYYDNLASYDNWNDMGIAYAFPNLQESYYGVVNNTNSEGVFRISDNAGTTPGMKFWTWGAQQGLNADPENFYENARPYIELWSGLSTQFFEDASLDANETLSWTETYLTSLGMDDVSTVNEHGALHVETISGEEARFETSVFMNLPDSVFTLDIDLEGEIDISILKSEFTAQSNGSSDYTLYLADYAIPDGDYELKAVISRPEDDEVLSYAMPVTVPFPASGIPQQNISIPRVIRLDANNYKLMFSTPAQRDIKIFSINGQDVDQQISNGTEARIHIETPGFYILYILERGLAYPVKIHCR